MEGALKGSKSDLDRLEGWFEAAEHDSEDARTRAERDRDYKDGWQLTDEEIAELRRRGQPAVVINRIRRKVSWLQGLEAQRRTDPKGFARTPDGDQGAEAATDAIRYVCDNTDWDRKRSAVWENLLVEGAGAVEVVHKMPKEDLHGTTSLSRRGPEIVINHYHWDRIFWDQHSREHDFSDARFKGAVVWKDIEEVHRMWPKSKGEIVTGEGSWTETYADYPRNRTDTDGDRTRVRIVLMWYKSDDKWFWARFTKGFWLDGGESPYVDEDGESLCPFIMQSCYVDRQGNRYGVVRDMIDPQDEINKRRSKALFQMSARQTYGTQGAVKSIAEMKRELARPDGHIEIARGDDHKWEIIPSNDQASGHLALLQEAKDEIDMLGANSALAGETGESASGRAVLARQQGGMVEVAPLFDLLFAFSQRVFRTIWFLVRQLWTEEKWVRVTDNERNTRFVGLNRPVTLQEKLKRLPDDQAMQMALHMRLVPGDPRLQMPVEVDNAVEEIDVDIILEEVPDEVSLQGETFDALVKLAPVVGAAVGPAYAQLLIETAPMRSEARDRLLEGMEQAQQQQAPIQGAMVEAQARKAQAEAAQAEQQAGAFAV